MKWTKAHSVIMLALLGVVFLHVKGEPSWTAVFTTASIGELGGQIITTLVAMFVGSPMLPKWDGIDRREEPVGIGASATAPPFVKSSTR